MIHSDFSPLFIVGFERSGTTLLAALLDRHSCIAVAPETHFFDQILPNLQSKRKISPRTKLVDRLLSFFRMKDMAIDRSKLLARFKGYTADYSSLFRATLEEYAENQCKSICGEKSPSHTHFVALILRWYPRAKVINIVRDGRDAVLSVMKAPWWTNKNLRRHCREWRWCVKLGLRYEKRFPDNFMTINYEDVLRRPKQSLMRIDRFLNVTFEDRQLDLSIPTSVVPKWELQWKGKAQSKLDPSRIGAWRKTATPDERWVMNSMMGKYLTEYHYPDVSLQGCSLSRHLRERVQNLYYLFIYHPGVRAFLRAFKHMLNARESN